MKIINRIITLCIALALVLTALASCTSLSGNALVIGDRKISGALYKAVALSLKSQFMEENNLEDTPEIWSKYVDETYSTTLEDYLNAMIQSYFIEYALYSKHFDELGLSLSESSVKKIEDDLNTYVNQYGGMEQLEQSLQKQGFSLDFFKQQYYDDAKKAAVIMYYYGPEGKDTAVTDDDLYAYYSEYYTKVKHVFLSTQNKDGSEMLVGEKEQVGNKAQEIYALAQGGTDFETLIDQYNEDPGMASNPDGYIFSKDDQSYTRMFYNTAFDMQPGELRLIQTNLGYHIMKRYPFSRADIEKEDTRLSLVENMMSSEASHLVDSLKERIGVTYNKNLLTNLSVTKIGNLSAQESEKNVLDARDFIEFAKNSDEK